MDTTEDRRDNAPQTRNAKNAKKAAIASRRIRTLRHNGRSLMACSRCRRLKLRCSGPASDGEPCVRCSNSKSDCAFETAERDSESSAPTDPDRAESKITHLEERLKHLESIIETDLRPTQLAVQKISDHIGLSTEIEDQPSSEPVELPDAEEPAPVIDETPQCIEMVSKGIETMAGPRKFGNLVDKSILTEKQCRSLYNSFQSMCSEVVAFLDNRIPSFQDLCESPIYLAAVCTIGARALKEANCYDRCLKEFYWLVQNFQFSRHFPTLELLKGILLMAVWHKNTRLWGLALSISYEMGLPDIALGLQNDWYPYHEDADLLDKAKTWLSFCCMDLGRHINSHYFISDLQRYTGLGKYLYKVKGGNIEYRIAAYLELFQIANDAKGKFQFSDNVRHMYVGNINVVLLRNSNRRLDAWWKEYGTPEDPPANQSYSKPQDRNRMMIPYHLIRMYVNGFVAHGIEPFVDWASAINPDRLDYIREAINSARGVLRVAMKSKDYLETLKHSIDYADSAFGAAINFLIYACSIANQQDDCRGIMQDLSRVQDIFTQIGLHNKAKEIENAIKELLKPHPQPGRRLSDGTIAEKSVDEIPELLSNFRLPLSDFSLDQASLERIFLYSGA